MALKFWPILSVKKSLCASKVGCKLGLILNNAIFVGRTRSVLDLSIFAFICCHWWLFRKASEMSHVPISTSKRSNTLAKDANSPLVPYTSEISLHLCNSRETTRSTNAGRHRPSSLSTSQAYRTFRFCPSRTEADSHSRDNSILRYAQAIFAQFSAGRNQRNQAYPKALPLH